MQERKVNKHSFRLVRKAVAILVNRTVKGMETLKWAVVFARKRGIAVQTS